MRMTLRPALIYQGNGGGTGWEPRNEFPHQVWGDQAMS